MEQKLVQRCETEIVADACNASYDHKPSYIGHPFGDGPVTILLHYYVYILLNSPYVIKLYYHTIVLLYCLPVYLCE